MVILVDLLFIVVYIVYSGVKLILQSCKALIILLSLLINKMFVTYIYDKNKWCADSLPSEIKE